MMASTVLRPASPMTVVMLMLLMMIATATRAAAQLSPICLPGQYLDSTDAFNANASEPICLACPIGRFTEQPNNATSCQSCGIHTISYPAASSAIGATACLDCLIIKAFETDWSDVCSCPPYLALPLATNCSCKPPYYENQTSVVRMCRQCPPGRIAIPGQTTCSSCGAGYSSPSTLYTRCWICNAGTYSDAPGSRRCLDCSGDSFAAADGSTRCSDCDPLYARVNPMNTACTALSPSEVSNCPPGYSLTIMPATNTSVWKKQLTTIFGSKWLPICAPCPAGRISFANNSQDCSVCSPGSYQANKGSTFCVSCNAGTFSSTIASASCPPCRIGLHQPSGGQSACLECPVARYANYSGAPSCTPIANLSSCPAGRFWETFRCEPCPVGYAQPFAGQTHCFSCAAGTFALQSMSGAVRCEECPDNTYSSGVDAECVPCPAGKQSFGSRLQCIDCPKGWFSQSGSPCVACPRGRSSWLYGSTTCGECVNETLCDFPFCDVLYGNISDLIGYLAFGAKDIGVRPFAAAETTCLAAFSATSDAVSFAVLARIQTQCACPLPADAKKDLPTLHGVGDECSINMRICDTSKQCVALMESLQECVNTAPLFFAQLGYITQQYRSVCAEQALAAGATKLSPLFMFVFAWCSIFSAHVF